MLVTPSGCGNAPPRISSGNVSSPVEQMYQEIGREAVGAAGGDLAGKLIVYAEAQDGVISADVVYASRQTGGVRLRLGPASLKRAVYDFWDLWRQDPRNREWRVMCYVIDDGRFSIDLSYPDDLEPGEYLSDRRPRAVEKYFGAVQVDYVRP
jgi:hypothetical protein